MKKATQFLFVITALLLISSYANAGINNVSISTTSKELKALNTKGGSLPILITVNDEYGKPIAGAYVNAPCTGLAPQYTDATGTATFKITTSCRCEGAQAEVKTNGCDQFITLTCGSGNNAICED